MSWYSHLLGVLNLNAFEVRIPVTEFFSRDSQSTDDPEVAAGTALYHMASRFNHSCAPNTKPFWVNDHTIHTRLLDNVMPGCELTISYLDLNWDVKRRQRYLEDNYGFVCDCDRCRQELLTTVDPPS